MKYSILGIALLLAANSTIGSAQTAGMRVRLRTLEAGDWTVGTLVSAESLAVVLGAAGGQLVFPKDSIERLEVSRGMKSNAGKGALIGLGIGVGLGVVIGATAETSEDCQAQGDSWCWFTYSRSESVLIASAMMGAVGTGLGALFGVAAKSERWEEVPVDRLRVRLVAQRAGRLGLGLSVPF